MSEQKAEQTNGEPGSLSGELAVPNSSDMQIEPVAALAQPSIDAESPKAAPEQAAAGTLQIEALDTHAPKTEADKTEAGKTEAGKAETGTTETGKVMIMLSSDRGWDGKGAGSKAESEPNQGAFGKRRRSALAAVVALA